MVPTNTPPANCSNQGLAYAVQDNPFINDYSTTDPYASFNASYFQTAPVEYQSTTTKLGFNASDGSPPQQVYDQGPKFTTTNITINNRGYLYAKESGNYTFSAPSVDDIFLLWLGPDAYNNYTRRNANLVQNYINPAAGSSATTYSIYLQKGTYTPIRFIYANAEAGGNYALTLTAPDGSVIISSNTEQTSPYLVQFSCDGSAPRFPPFGDDGPGSSASSATPSSSSSSSQTPTSTITRTTGLQSVRSTTTVTMSASGTAPAQVIVETPLCTPGLRWAFYNLTESPDDASHAGQVPSDSGNNTQDYQDAFQVKTILDGQNPDVTGTTQLTGIPGSDSNDNVTLYGGQTYDYKTPFNAIQEIGYFHPDQNGTYTFTFSNTDDTAYLWLGDSAQPSSYDNSNYNLYDTYHSDPRTRTYTQSFTADSFVPIRILGGNAERYWAYNLTITDPNGNVVSSASQDVTDQQLVTGCTDSTNAAPFAFN